MIEQGRWYYYEVRGVGLAYNMEIDYKKLADAIVDAQNRVNADEQTHNKSTSKTFAGFIAFFLRGMAMVSLPGIILLGFQIHRIVDTLSLGEDYLTSTIKIVAAIFLPLIGFVAGSYAVLLWNSAKEIEAEKDKNYIISVFSGLVSFAALIVALVALVKG